MRVVLIVMLLAACATPEEKAQKMSAEYGGTCTALGFTPGTENHASCILRMYEANKPRAVLKLN